MNNVDKLDDAAQISLFELYNHQRENGGLLLVCGQSAPVHLYVRDDLRTRLDWGLVYQVHALNDSEKEQSLQQHARTRGLLLPKEVSTYLLRHGRRDLPVLLATLDALDEHCLRLKCAASVPLLKEVMSRKLWQVRGEFGTMLIGRGEVPASRFLNSNLKGIKMLKRATFAALVLAVLPTQGNAADGTARLDAHMSTLGGGLEIGAAISENLSGRVGFNKYSFNYNDTSGGQTFDGKLNWSSVSALLDWRPWSGVTHLTAGVIFNSNKIDARARVANGSIFTADGVNYSCTTAGGCGVDSSIAFNKVAPYLGIGWSGHPKKQGFSLSTDIGVIFQGSPHATVSSIGMWTVGGNSASTSILDADAQNQLNSDLSRFKYYPVVSVGLGYTF